jgi:hypothetical protein
MSKPKSHAQEKFDELNELLNYYTQNTKGETLCAQKGLMMGWLARLASTDWLVAQELSARLEIARQKYSSSEDTSSPRHPRP